MYDTYIRVYTQVQSVDSNCCCGCDTSSLHFTHALFFFFTLVLALPYVTLSKIGAHHPVQLRTTKKKKERKKERVSTTP